MTRGNHRRRRASIALDAAALSLVVVGCAAFVVGHLDHRGLPRADAVGTVPPRRADASPPRPVGSAPPSPAVASAGGSPSPALEAGSGVVAPPTELSIPAIGVRTGLVRLGLNTDGTLQVPNSFSVAGWYDLGPRPGAPGASVIAGHVDSTAGPAVFFRLRDLTPGARVDVRRADGTTAVFRVYAVREYAKTAFPSTTVYGPARRPELRLITCGGAFDASTGHYVDNVVVFARGVSAG